VGGHLADRMGYAANRRLGFQQYRVMEQDRPRGGAAGVLQIAHHAAALDSAAGKATKALVEGHAFCLDGRDESLPNALEFWRVAVIAVAA